MTSLNRRFAMFSVVLAAFALAGTTGLWAEDASSVDYHKPNEKGRRWGPATNGLQIAAQQYEGQAGRTFLLWARNEGKMPLRLLRLDTYFCHNLLSLEFKTDGKVFRYCGPQLRPPPPPPVNAYISIDPGAVHSWQARIRLVDWDLADPEGVAITFIYANDSATADASPFDQTTQKWQQVTGLWTGTVRSGTSKYNAVRAQEKSTPSEQSDDGHPDAASKHGDLLTAYLDGNMDAGARLRQINEDAQPAVARIWEKLSETDRWKLLRELPKCVHRELAKSQAISSLDADSDLARQLAVRWLDRHGTPAAKPRLLERLHAEKSDLRYTIVRVLADIGGEDVVDAMVELSAPDSWVAKGTGLGRFHGPQPYWWPDFRCFLIHAFQELEDRRPQATYGFREREVKRSELALLKILQEKGKGKGYLGEFIIPVLADLGYDEAIPELKTILATGEIAGVHLPELPPEEYTAARKRIKAKVNRWAARALLQFGDRSGCALLNEELASGDGNTISFVAETFARFGDEADIPALERCRTHKDASYSALRAVERGLERINKERDRDPNE